MKFPSFGGRQRTYPGPWALRLVDKEIATESRQRVLRIVHQGAPNSPRRSGKQWIARCPRVGIELEYPLALLLFPPAVCMNGGRFIEQWEDPSGDTATFGFEPPLFGRSPMRIFG